MRTRTAVLLVRSPLGSGTATVRRALAVVLAAADAGVPGASRLVARALRSRGPDVVWRVWLDARRSVRPARRWTDPAALALLEGPGPVPEEVVDAAWRDWDARPEPRVWALLEGWGRRAGDGPVELSRLALGEADVPAHALAVLAARFDHPIGERARGRLLAAGDPRAVDLFCEAAAEAYQDAPAAAEFCAEHHLAPSGEADRAVFFVRSGQREQYRALDPDGALLALGYQGASSARARAELRAAMAAFGDIDTLRVLAGRGSVREDFVSLTEQERGYLVGRLADRQEWDRLWPLVLLMPLAEAVEAARVFDGWRPPPQECDAFDALRAADPRAVRAVVDALAGEPGTALVPRARIGVGDLDPRFSEVDDLSFSPDSTELAVVGEHTDGYGGWAGIVDLRTRTLSRPGTLFPYPLCRVAHLGAGTAAVAEDIVDDLPSEPPSDLTSGRTSDPPSDQATEPPSGPPPALPTAPASHETFPLPRLHIVGPRAVRTLDLGADEIVGLARIAGDRAFAVSLWTSEDVVPDGPPRLLVGTADGPLVGTDALGGPDSEYGFEPLAAAPDSRLLATCDGPQSRIVVADVPEPRPNGGTGGTGGTQGSGATDSPPGSGPVMSGRAVNRLDVGDPSEKLSWAPGAMSPTALAWCTRTGRLAVWDDPLTSSEPARTFPVWGPPRVPSTLAWSSVLGRFVALHPNDSTPSLDVLSLPASGDGTVPEPPVVVERWVLAHEPGMSIARVSPRGDLLAVGTSRGTRTIDVYLLATLALRPFAARPMGLMTYHHLAGVRAAQEHPLLDEETRPVLALLRTCLEHRFRHDVGIAPGGAGPAATGTYEIALDPDREG